MQFLDLDKHKLMGVSNYANFRFSNAEADAASILLQALYGEGGHAYRLEIERFLARQ